MQFPATLVQLAEKPPPLFCLFVRDLAHFTHVEYPWFPYYKSTLRFLLAEFLFRSSTLSRFQNTHIYRSKRHGIIVQVIGL